MNLCSVTTLNIVGHVTDQQCDTHEFAQLYCSFASIVLTDTSHSTPSLHRHVPLSQSASVTKTSIARACIKWQGVVVPVQELLRVKLARVWMAYWRVACVWRLRASKLARSSRVFVWSWKEARSLARLWRGERKEVRSLARRARQNDEKKREIDSFLNLSWRWMKISELR